MRDTARHFYPALNFRNSKGLWSSGKTPHSHCGSGSSILPRSKTNFKSENFSAGRIIRQRVLSPSLISAQGGCASGARLGRRFRLGPKENSGRQILNYYAQRNKSRNNFRRKIGRARGVGGIGEKYNGGD